MRFGIYAETQCPPETPHHGTPDQVIAQIKRLDAAVGSLQEMVIISNFGGIEHWKATKTQELFARYVMPAFA